MKKLSSTPFCGNDEYVFMARTKGDMEHSDCSVKMIENLIKKESLNEIDLKIMDLLFEYRILNAFLIQKILKKNAYTAKENYLKNLNKLREYGIILYYEREDRQAAYILSDGAKVYEYLKNGEKRKHLTTFKEKLDGKTVNKTIVSNAMFINIDMYGRGIKKYAVKFDYFRFFTLKCKEKLNFLIIPMRRGDQYINTLLEGISKANGLFFARDYFVVALCEDVRQFDEVNDELKKSFLPESNILYTTDRMALLNGAMGMYIRNEQGYASIDFV